LERWRPEFTRTHTASQLSMKVTDLVPFVLPEVPGCPDALIKQNIVLSAIEFCTETLAWQEIQDSLIMIDGQPELDVEVPTDARIVVIKDIWASSRKLSPVTMNQLFEKIPNWQDATGSEPSYYNASTDWRTIRVFPMPMGANRAKLRMRAAYAPTLTATTLPDEITTKYLDGIVGGAKARLMAMHGKTWSNVQGAGIYRQQFNDSTVKARIDDLHDRVQGSLSVRPVSFA
jgi:hypothetical protein